MIIRPAHREDAVPVARLMVQAMHEIALQFVGGQPIEKAYSVFQHFFTLQDNQYSYQNTLVCVEDDSIVGSITGYDGGDLIQLRQPFLEYLRQNFDFHLSPEDETEAGEFYIDVLSVSDPYQGKGIGKQLLEGMIAIAKERLFSKVGLLVAPQNEGAKRLYQRLGFVRINTKILLGEMYDHMVIQL